MQEEMNRFLEEEMNLFLGSKDWHLALQNPASGKEICEVNLRDAKIYSLRRKKEHSETERWILIFACARKEQPKLQSWQAPNRDPAFELTPTPSIKLRAAG
jgi:hypothetical protein